MPFFLGLQLAQIRRSQRATIFNKIALNYFKFRGENGFFFRNLRWGFFLSSNVRDTMFTENRSSLKKSTKRNSAY